MSGGEVGTNSGGGRGLANGSAGQAGGGACGYGTGTRGRAWRAGGGGVGREREAVRAPAAGALSGRTAGSAGDSVRLPRRSVGCGPHVVPATSPPP